MMRGRLLRPQIVEQATGLDAVTPKPLLGQWMNACGDGHTDQRIFTLAASALTLAASGGFDGGFGGLFWWHLENLKTQAPE
jgi:hypothetical protein